MKTLSNNDTWILRTFIKVNEFLSNKTETAFEDYGRLNEHVRQMTYKNRATDLRDVYEDLRQITITYFKGSDEFLKMLNNKKFKAEIKRLNTEYAAEIAAVSK